MPHPYLNHPIRIDFLDFLKTGKFDYLKLGQTIQEVEQILPLPDEKVEEHKAFDLISWRYAELVLNFRKQKLADLRLYAATDRINFGDAFKVYPWIFERPDQLSMEQVILSLTRAKIDFMLFQPERYDPYIFCLKAGVRIDFWDNFEEERPRNEYLLSKMSWLGSEAAHTFLKYYKY
jgi:hypothetical protein